MSASVNKVFIKADASVFCKRIGDSVKKGEILGKIDDDDVKAPFNGRIESVFFDSEEHALIVVLVEKESKLQGFSDV
jgi:pyruvate/2-oxoglutarate dehydrogenase complex dihydrolipoamide acyltransferase (E2) component